MWFGETLKRKHLVERILTLGSGKARQKVNYSSPALSYRSPLKSPHLHDLLVHGLSRLVSITPVVASTNTTLSDVEIFRVIYVLVWTRLYAVDDSGLKVYENGARDVSRVVALVVEDILSVTALGSKVLEVAVLVDAMLLT